MSRELMNRRMSDCVLLPVVEQRGEGSEEECLLEVRGEKAGHAFHGNQWSGSISPQSSRKELLAAAEATGYTGPTSYSKPKLYEVVSNHIATTMGSVAPEVSTPAPTPTPTHGKVEKVAENTYRAYYGDGESERVTIWGEGSVTLSEKHAQAIADDVGFIREKVRRPPSAVAVFDARELPGDMMHLRNSQAYVSSRYPTTIYLERGELGHSNPSPVTRNTGGVGAVRAKGVSERRITLLHESGHVDDFTAMGTDHSISRSRLYKAQTTAGGIALRPTSQYALTHPREAYAEAFADYHGNGTAASPTAKVYAKEFGW